MDGEWPIVFHHLSTLLPLGAPLKPDMTNLCDLLSTYSTPLYIPVKEEFSHPVESLALTVDEVINVRRVLVKAEMEKYIQNKELYSNLRRGKVQAVTSYPFILFSQSLMSEVLSIVYVCVSQVCCCCRIKFPLFSWPSTCLLCKR